MIESHREKPNGSPALPKLREPFTEPKGFTAMVAQTTCSPARQCWLRAWDRARTEKLIPFRNVDGTWTVKSYTVRVTGAGWSALSCDCAAGRNTRVCKHVAVTAKAIAAGVRPIRPALVAVDGAERAAHKAVIAAEVAAGIDPLAVCFG